MLRIVFAMTLVSLKDQFYTEADALVGVAKDAQRAASVPFTLDLGAYA